MSEQWQQEVEATLSGSVPLPEVNTKVDVYDPVGTEILLFEDGIQVKAQKETRPRQHLSASKLEGSMPGLVQVHG